MRSTRCRVDGRPYSMTAVYKIYERHAISLKPRFRFPRVQKIVESAVPPSIVRTEDRFDRRPLRCNNEVGVYGVKRLFEWLVQRNLFIIF